MTEFVSNLIQNSLSGFVSGTVTTAGGYVGDAMNSAADAIERKGQSVGDGIAKTVDGWGKGIAGYYGAPTSTQQSKAATTKPSAGSKPAVTQKKISPSTQNKRVAPSTTTKPTVGRPATGAVGAKPTRPTATRVKSDNTVVKSAKPATDSKKPASQLAKPKTTTTGKVVPAKSSLPQNKSKAASTLAKSKDAGNTGYKGPIPVGGSDFKANGGYTGFKPTKEYKPNSGYEGPLNLKGIAPSGPAAKPSSAGNTSSKPKAGGYQGPLKLGGLA